MKTGEKYYFQKLVKGSWFNFTNSYFGYHSLFQYEAREDCDILVLEKEDLEAVAKMDHNLHHILRDLKSSFVITGLKYDFYYCKLQKKAARKKNEGKNIYKQKIHSGSPIKRPLIRKGWLKMSDDFETDSFIKQFTFKRPKIFKVLLKFSTYRRKLINQIRKSEPLFRLIDANYQNRIIINTKTTLYQNLNMTKILWILRTIVPKTSEIEEHEIVSVSEGKPIW